MDVDNLQPRCRLVTANGKIERLDRFVQNLFNVLRPVNLPLDLRNDVPRERTAGRQQDDDPSPLRIFRRAFNDHLPEVVLRARQPRHDAMDNFQAAELASGIVGAFLTIWI